ncbi:unnamed protein product [Gordionus sp. m RMFG-2023]
MFAVLSVKKIMLIVIMKESITPVPTKLQNSLDVYCFGGKRSNIKFLLSSAKLRWKFKNENKNHFLIFKGSNYSDIYRQYKQTITNWYNLIPSWKVSKINLDTFELSCVGIYTKDSYDVHFNFFLVDYQKLILLTVGVFLFFSASSLSRNLLFYYTFGIIFGILASFLIIVYLISRLIPQRKGATYLLLAGGWSFSLFILQYLWENIQFIILRYTNYLIGYIIIAGFISFLICYYKGPPNNPKTLRMIQWTIQGISLYLIYQASNNFKQTSILLSTFIILTQKMLSHQSTDKCSKYNPIGRLKHTIHIYCLKKFPPKIKLLTEEEYIQQGELETEKHLNELKKYCQGPNCTPWKLAKMLKNPKRFASFIEGDSLHVSEEEAAEWDNDAFSNREFSYSSIGDNDQDSKLAKKPSAPPLHQSSSFTNDYRSPEYLDKHIYPLNLSKRNSRNLNSNFTLKNDINSPLTNRKVLRMARSCNVTTGRNNNAVNFKDYRERKKVGDYLRDIDSEQSTDDESFHLTEDENDDLLYVDTSKTITYPPLHRVNKY